MSEIGTCGEEALHGDVRHAGPNNTTGGQPGAATYWALLLTMCREAPKSGEDRRAARPPPALPPADLYIWTGRARPVTSPARGPAPRNGGL